ncbi:MAG: DUF721 domain-containing protein [Proteobacteria bacterium]|nr:DUF721 domain-containing protein [Pseudomonadota bacterium]
MHAKMQVRSDLPPKSVAQITRLRVPGPAAPAAKSRLAEAARRLPDRQPGGASGGIKPVLAKTVGSFVPRLTRPAFERYGFSAAALITDWDTIVGTDIARYTRPERLKWPKRIDWAAEGTSEAEKGRPGAMLMLAVAQGRALDIEYKSAQLVERINAYFGYRAISGLRILQVAAIAGDRSGSTTIEQKVVKARPAVAPKAPGLATIADPGLKSALERMAAGLEARKLRGAAAA